MIKKALSVFCASLFAATSFAQPALAPTDVIYVESATAVAKQTVAAIVGFQSVISPSQITANQNDYNPTGFSTATLVRLDFDNTGKVITGFTAWTNGTTKQLINIGSNYGVIACEHPSSSSANRVTGTADYIFPPGCVVEIIYDATSGKVRVLSTTFQPQNLGSFHKGMYVNVPTASVTAADNSHVAFTSVGTAAAVAAIAPASGVPRGLSMGTGSTSTGATAISSLKDGESARWGENHIVGFATVYIPTLSDGTNRFTADFAVSLINGTTAALPDRSSVGIKYTDNANSGAWLLYNVDHSQVQGSTTSSVTVAANTLYVLMVVVDRALSESRYFINGAYVGRMTTNMPQSGVVCGVRCDIVKSVGTTSRAMVVSNIGFLTVNN